MIVRLHHKMRIKILIAALLLITAIGIPAVAGTEESTILTAERTNETITIDGNANEPSWEKARELDLTVQDGSIGKAVVHIQALYDDTYVYFYATWLDETENTIRKTWIYDNNTWHKLADTDKNAENEDRIIFLWNIDDSIAGFNIAGCAMTCHGDRHHTNSPTEVADTWHCKASRTGPAGYCDDKYWDNSLEESTDEEALEAARLADAKISGGYKDNKNDDGTAPLYYEPNPENEEDAKYLFKAEIDSGEAREITNETVPQNGATAPGYILERPEGSRGDIETGSIWENNAWHVEIKRKLDTGHDDDVRFETTKLYRFGVAICDNAAGFEAYGKGHSFDLGARTLEFGGIGSKEITQLVLINDYLTTARAYIDRGETGLAFSEINYALALYNEIRDVVADTCPTHYLLIKKGFVESKRHPSVENIDALMKHIDEVVLLFQGKMDPHEPTWDLKLIVAWGKIQLYVFILLALFAMYPLYKTVQVGRGPELRRMSIFLAIAIAPMVFEGIGRIGIHTHISFLQNFSFMTNEYATLLWAVLMFIALLVAVSGFREVTTTIHSLKTLSTSLEQKVVERTRDVTRAKEYTEGLMNSIREGIMVIDRNYKIAEINPAIAEMAKMPKGEIIGKHCYEISHRRDRPCEAPDDICPLKEVFKTGEPFKVTHKHFDKDGNPSFVEIVASPVRGGNGEITHVIEVSRDITDRIEARQKLEEYAKQLEHSNRLKDMFTDILRHDLLNPIGVIGNIADIIGEDERLKDSAELPVIKRNIRKLEEIVHNAADYAKLESAEPEMAELDLAELIERVIDDFGPYIKEKGMNVEFRPEGEHKANANVIIESVFVNLLSNAIKYSPEGTNIKIAIKDSGKNWKVSFADQGEGIPDEHKEAVFDRLTRKDKIGVKGTGLGLAIVRRMVEMHSGRAWVEDNLGGGSIFYVEIPKSEP